MRIDNTSDKERYNMTECTRCNDGVSKTYRNTHMAHCEACDENYCIDCLAEMAIEHKLLCRQNAEAIVKQGQADALLFHCTATDREMCADCFETE